MIGFCFMFLIFNRLSFLSLFSNVLFKYWFLLIAGFPIISLFIHYIVRNITRSEFIYWFGIYLLSCGIFSCTCLLISRIKNVRTINLFYGASFVVTIFGVWLSIEYYDLVRAFMTLNRSTEEIAYVISEKIRVVGFYDHPNIVARSFVFSSIFLFGSYFYNKSKFYISSFILVLLTFLLLTGSRTALILIAIFLTIYFPQFLFKKIFLIKGKFIIPYKIAAYLSIPLIFLFLFILFNFVSNYLIDLGYGDLVRRFTSLFNFGNEFASEDLSAQYRVTVFFQYLHEISKSLLIGHGPILRSEYISKGIFIVASQNQFLEDAFSFGVFYVLFFIHTLRVSYTYSKTSIFLFSYKYLLFFKLFLLIFFVYCFSVNYMLIDDLMLIVLGTYVGAIISLSNFQADNKYG